MDRLIGRILDKIRPGEEDYILLDEPGQNFLVKKENFFDIQEIQSNKTISFIDGGNLELLKSPSVSLHFNRLCRVTYKQNKRVSCDIQEFYSLIHAENVDNELFFHTECFPTKGNMILKEYQFSSFDKTIVAGNRRASVSKIGDILRRYAELEFAKKSKADIIVLDGTLEPVYTGEKDLLEELCMTRTVCALSKTSSLLTNNGNSVVPLLSQLTNKPVWSYLVGHDHGCKIYFLKLHPKSDYIFRFETNKEEEALALLKANSKDPIFLGYPYGLVEADRFARVSNQEKEALQIQLKVKFKKDFAKIKPYLNSLNAHDILDNIS